MPVFNSRREELREAVESALGQTLQAIELVCVDDGSLDDTLERLEAFSRKDSRLRIVSLQGNHGTLAARNAAILAATGRYVLPLDPDDSLRAETCEVLSEIMDTRALDMVQFAVETSAGGERYRTLTNPTKDEDLSPAVFAESVFMRQRRSWAVIAKMFRRAPLAAAATTFPSGYCANGEDGLLLLGFLASARRVGCTPRALYRYRYGNGLSTSGRPSRAQADRIMRSLRYSMPWLKDQGCPQSEAYRHELLRMSLGALVRSRMDVGSRTNAVRNLAGIAASGEISALLKSFAPVSRSGKWFVQLKYALARRSGRRRKLLRKLALSARVERLASAASSGREGGMS
jgi:glycosyltransferase involved in cell wall biosynthesis